MLSKYISHIQILFEQNKRAFFGKMRLEYLFDISNKANLFSEDLYVHENFTLASKIQTFLYSEVFQQPAPGCKKSFYICRRSAEKCKYSFLVTLFRLVLF